MPLPPGVRAEQILKAVKALLKHIEKQKAKANELIEEDQLIFLVRHLIDCPMTASSTMPSVFASEDAVFEACVSACSKSP
jgi:hypothetical protein